jgi:hypothetical protein
MTVVAMPQTNDKADKNPKWVKVNIFPNQAEQIENMLQDQHLKSQFGFLSVSNFVQIAVRNEFERISNWIEKKEANTEQATITNSGLNVPKKGKTIIKTNEVPTDNEQQTTVKPDLNRYKLMEEGLKDVELRRKERRKAEEEARRKIIEDELKRREQEIKKREEVFKSKEEETLKRNEEEARIKKEEELKRKEEERKKEEEKQRRLEEEKKKKFEEELRLKTQEEARKKADEEANRKIEEERKRIAEERLKIEEERRKAEEDRKRIEEEHKKAQEDLKRKAEEARKKAEDETRRKAEEDARLKLNEAQRKVEDMKLRFKNADNNLNTAKQEMMQGDSSDMVRLAEIIKNRVKELDEAKDLLKQSEREVEITIRNLSSFLNITTKKGSSEGQTKESKNEGTVPEPQKSNKDHSPEKKSSEMIMPPGPKLPPAIKKTKGRQPDPEAQKLVDQLFNGDDDDSVTDMILEEVNPTNYTTILSNIINQGFDLQSKEQFSEASEQFSIAVRVLEKIMKISTDQKIIQACREKIKEYNQFAKELRNK